MFPMSSSFGVEVHHPSPLAFNTGLATHRIGEGWSLVLHRLAPPLVRNLGDVPSREGFLLTLPPFFSNGLFLRMSVSLVGKRPDALSGIDFFPHDTTLFVRFLHL